MKYKVIVNGTETLCNKVTIDGFDYYMGKLDIGIKDYFEVNGEILQCLTTQEADDLAVSNDYPKVIATNSPNIDIPKVVDEVEKLAENDSEFLADWEDKGMYSYGFLEGYNKAKETHPYSEADVKEIFEIAQIRKDYGDYKPYTFDEAIELWQSQRTITIHAV